MERKLKLSKDAYLWEEGDNAHNIAILEAGKLGVKVGNRIVGVISPKMVLGEVAIFTLDGKAPKRTATIVSLEDGTQVTEYPAVLVKKTFDAGNDAVAQLILVTLIGQVARNGLLVMSTHKSNPAIAVPLKSLMQGVISAKDHLKELKTWDDLMVTFRFLADLRDYTESLRKQFVIMTSDKAELIEKASATIREMVSDKDLVPMLEAFIKEEQSKSEWLEYGA